MISDWGLAARFLVALAVVLALIAAATWFARRYLGPGLIGGLAGRRRLSVVEYAILDGKSRLVLIRRDGVEHLLVVGPAGATVVETGIAAASRGESPAPPSANVAAMAPPRGEPGTTLRTLLSGKP